MTEFWPELLTTASWQKLQQLKTELKNFVVIGGWAVYLWTGMHKSKGIDIIVDYKSLEELKQTYELSKNPHLKKYEIKLEKFDIDVYVPHFSKFALPFDKISTTLVQGFKVPEPEILLILKQGAEIQRKGSVKGEKDAIDILTLLAKAPFSTAKYWKLLKAHNLANYADELLRVIKDFDPKNVHHIGLTFREFQTWKKKLILDLFKKNQISRR